MAREFIQAYQRTRIENPELYLTAKGSVLLNPNLLLIDGFPVLLNGWHRYYDSWIVSLSPMMMTLTLHDISTFYHLEFHCPKPPEVGHAHPNVSETRQQHGTTIGYQCNHGYTLESSTEQTVLYCQKTTWVGNLPTCIPAKVVPITQEKTTKKSVVLDDDGKWGRCWTIVRIFRLAAQ